MKFIVGNGTVIHNPTSDQIAETLRDLPGGRDSFVVLEASSQFFVQCAGSEKEKFLIEYCEGDNTFRAIDENCSLELVTEALQRYAFADADWGDTLEWSPFEYEAPDPSEDTGLSPMKREKLVDYHTRTIVLGRSWILKTISILIAILVIVQFVKSGWGLGIGIPILICVACWIYGSRSNAEKRGYRH